MKRHVTLMLALLMVLAVSMNVWAAKKTGTGKKSMTETTTISATIVKVDIAANTVTLKDQDGKLWEFMIPSKSSIDLNNYTAGDMVTATGEIDPGAEGTVLTSIVKKRGL